MGVAEAMEREGRYTSAVEVYTQALKTHPQNSYILAHRAVARSEAGEYVQALIDFDAALSLKPDAPVTLMFRAETKSKLGDLDGALEDYHASAQLNPDDERPWEEIGLIHEFRRNREKAEEAYLQVLKLSPCNPIALEGLAKLQSIPKRH